MKLAVLLFSLLLIAQDVLADETVTLACKFEHGVLDIHINYTRETANDSPAMISDKEIVWSPGKNNNSLAIINRYTGVMTMGNDSNEFTGLCKKTSKAGK